MRSFKYVQMSLYGAVHCFAFEVSVESVDYFIRFVLLFLVISFFFTLREISNVDQ